MSGTKVFHSGDQCQVPRYIETVQVTLWPSNAASELVCLARGRRYSCIF